MLVFFDYPSLKSSEVMTGAVGWPQPGLNMA
jgi:hypothetical protein